MRYDVSFYQDNLGTQLSDILLLPMIAKSDRAIVELAREQAETWNKKYEYQRYNYITIYRYVPQRLGWKTIIRKLKLF